MTQPAAQVRHTVARSGFANPLTLGILVADIDYLKVYADELELQVGVDYTVLGIGDANGVIIEIIGAEDVDAYVGYESFTALYDPPIQQGSDLSLGGNFGRPFEAALDSQNRQLQAINGRVDRSLKMPVNVDGDIVLPTPVDQFGLIWDADTQAFVWEAINSSGAAAAALPAGGLDGQLLAKASDGDFDAEWIDGAFNALSISFTPTGGISATDVQAALAELDSEKLSAAAADALFLTPAEGGAAYQPLDADLTAIAALSTQTYGRSLLTATAAEGVRDSLDAAPYVATRTVLKALDATKDTTAILTEDGRSGVFTFRAGDYSTQVAADTAEILYVKAAAIAATAGAWVRQGLWYFNGINVRWAGAVADGATDDRAAIQAALDLVKALGFQHLHFPGSPNAYKITGSLTYDISGIGSGRFDKRLKITGDGPASTVISMAGVADEAFEYIGANPSVESSFSVSGLRITGNNTVGSTGLKLTKVAFASTDHLIIEAFDYNLDCTDVEQTQFSNSNFRWGMHGVRFNAASGATSANSLNFLNCAIANNSIYGMLFTNPNAVQFLGGSIQYNGTTTGNSGQWGAKFTESGDGYGTVSMIGVAIEGNTGLSDIIVDQSTYVASYSFIGCGFARPNSSNYSTNFLKLTGTAALIVALSGNTWRGYATYVANAGRPYIARTNTNARIFDDGSNVYGSSTEYPGWAGLAAGHADGGHVFRIGADKNLRIGTAFTLAGGVMIQGLNDIYGSFAPLELRSSAILLSGGSTSFTHKFGYYAGAGGAVTQGTSRTTGVTLNKPSGAITLFSAAGSTSWQSFTVTNSVIEANDTIIVSQKSGADLYEVHVTAVANGSLRVSFRTTGGTTVEQPVFNFAVVKAVAA